GEPAQGGPARAGQGARPLPAGTRQPLHPLRRGHRGRRAQAPPPRRQLAPAGAQRHQGPGPAALPGHRRAAPAARPLSHRPRAARLMPHSGEAMWRVRVPRGTRDLALRLCRAIDELPQQLGHSPTVPELAESLETSMEEVLEAIEVAQTRSAPSLDQPAGEDGEAVLGGFVIDRRHREEPEDLLVLPQLIGRLPERERRIVLLRYVEELTQDEIAARMQISQMHVSRLLRRAIERMRCQLVDLQRPARAGRPPAGLEAPRLATPPREGRDPALLCLKGA